MSYALDIWAPAETEIAEIAKTEIAKTEAARRRPRRRRHGASPPASPWSAPATDDCVVDEDKDLLDRLADNDEHAFRSLVERHIDRAYAIALRILGNAADAEDVVQDTMLKVWTHRGRWQHGRAKFSTWLYRVVSNRCIDLRRKPRTENVDAVPEVADGQPGRQQRDRAQRGQHISGDGDAAAARAAAPRGDPLVS